MPPSRSASPVAEFLAARTVVELSEIQEALGGASAMTVSRHLRKVGYRRSYNHNGRFYALHVPERYDRHGLWSFGDRYFSVDGSLKGTVRRMVHEAVAGMTHRELAERLRVRAHNTLLDLLRDEEVAREMVGAVYVYLHCDPLVAKAQLRRRDERVQAAVLRDAALDSIVVIEVLLVLIRHPGSAPADVVRRLRGRSPPIKLPMVQAVFARYDLGKKRGASTC